MVNISFCYEGITFTGNDSERKQHFLQHKRKHSNSKKAYTDESKSTGRKVGFAAVFEDTAEMTAMRKIQKREGMRWAIYTDLRAHCWPLKTTEKIMQY